MCVCVCACARALTSGYRYSEEGSRTCTFLRNKVLNVLMLGAVAETGVLGFDPEEMLRVVRERVPARFVELNTKAFMTGRRMV